MGNKITNEEYQEMIEKQYGKDEYTLLSDYKNMNSKIYAKHNRCNFDFWVNANSFAYRISQCPVCTKGSKLNHEGFVKKVEMTVGDEYSVISEYKNKLSPITLRHNKCKHPMGYFDYDTTPHNFMRGARCLYCTNQVKVTKESYNEKLQLANPNLELIGEYVNSGTKTDFHCKVCDGIFDSMPETISRSPQCPYCNNHRVLKDFNDMWTTHPHVAKLLKNPEDGYKYVYGTTKELPMICPDCGNEITKIPRLYYNEAGNITCPKCKDGFSYPEKIMYNVLSQLGIEFKYQLSSKVFDWVDSYKYDFYLYDYNYIIEVNGMQHYQDTMWSSFEDVQLNDKRKLDLANKNGITKYIVIDARHSELDFIRQNILDSELGKMFNLSLIDWNKCEEYASTSMMIKICNEWDQEKSTIFEFIKLYNLSQSTIMNYLVKGAASGLCDFNREEYVERINRNQGSANKIKVQCVETGEVFSSQTEARKHIKSGDICRALDNPNKTAGGYHWITYGNVYVPNNDKKYVRVLLSKPISMYTLDDEYVDTYYYGCDIQKALNRTEIGNIYQVIKGQRKSAYGYKWAYAEDDQPINN